MKRDRLFALGLFSSLLVMSAVAEDRGETALGSAPAGADKAVTTEEQGETAAAVGRGTSSGVGAGKSKRAGTGTAAGYINDQVKKGNVKIQGATDADIYD